MSFLEMINTKKKAYNLIHDPTTLLSLIYSKYGDIEEDYNYLYLNQIIYNKTSHFNTIFKEYQYLYNIDEFLKRFYKLKESINRIPKLNDYYKNYLKFFCRPTFRNWKISEKIHNYEDKKAEIFYKKNYGNSEEEEKEKEKESSNKSSLSSLDNITNNKIIFDKKIKSIIDNNENISKVTLTLQSSKNIKDNLITNRSKDDSFIKSISPIINYKERKKKRKNNIFKNYNYSQRNKIKIHKLKKNELKNSLYNLIENNGDYVNLEEKKKKIFLSPKLKPYLSNYKTNLDEFNKNKKKKNKDINEKIKNKTYNNNKNLHSNIRNFSNLAITLNNNLLNNNISNTIRNNSHFKNFNISNSNSENKFEKNTINHFSINPNSDNSTIQKKEKTFVDIKNFNSVNQLKKLQSNFPSLKYQIGSNFNIMKNPINQINNKITHFIKNQTYNVENNLDKNNLKEKNKNLKNKFHKRHNNASYTNTLNLNNLFFSSQKSISNNSNNNILSQKNTINSNIHIMNLNFSNTSRNKKEIITHTHTNNIKSFRKENIHKTKSIDEEKIKLKKTLFGVTNKGFNYQMSQRLVKQIDRLMKKTNIPFIKNHSNFYNGTEKESKKSIIENSNNSINYTQNVNHMSCRNISKKLNLNKRIKSDDKKDRKIKYISSKK